MKYVAVFLLLALAAVADARDLSTYPRHRLDPHKKVVYCVKPVDYKGSKPQCPEHYECKPLHKTFCKVTGHDCKWVTTSHCLYSVYGKCTSYKKEYKCTEKKQCWDYSCVEKQLPCDPYAMYDECSQKYGKVDYGWSCMKLYKPQCTYKDVCTKHKGDCIDYAQEKVCKTRKECHQVKTDKCKAYHYDHKCDTYQDCKTVKGGCADYHYSTKRGPCKAYHYVDDCHYVPGPKCLVHHQQKRICDPYGNNCYYGKGGCKEFEQIKVCKAPKKAGCKDWHIISEKGACKRYHENQHCVPKQKCTQVKGACKDYYYDDVCKEVPECHYVPGKCIKYHEYDTCKKVEDHCIKGICEKKPAPKPKVVHRVHKPVHRFVKFSHFG